MKERAKAALTSLQRNAYAMSMLRSRLESRINLILNENSGDKSENYQELTNILELVKCGEMILNDMSVKIESARFLQEFILIIDAAAASVSEIKNDIVHILPMAETALQEIHDAIAKVSLGTPSELRQEFEQAILAEISASVVEEGEKSNALFERLNMTVQTHAEVSTLPDEKIEDPEGITI